MLALPRSPNGFQYVSKIPSFKAPSLNLLGEQSVHDRMVDVFKKLAVDSFIYFRHHPIGIHEQHGHAGNIVGGGGIRAGREQA